MVLVEVAGQGGPRVLLNTRAGTAIARTWCPGRRALRKNTSRARIFESRPCRPTENPQVGATENLGRGGEPHRGRAPDPHPPGPFQVITRQDVVVGRQAARTPLSAALVLRRSRAGLQRETFSTAGTYNSVYGTNRTITTHCHADGAPSSKIAPSAAPGFLIAGTITTADRPTSVLERHSRFAQTVTRSPSALAARGQSRSRGGGRGGRTIAKP